MAQIGQNRLQPLEAYGGDMIAPAHDRGLAAMIYVASAVINSP
ncbi:MAG: hypothetical protein ACR2KT_05190 [Methylocella sp.]